MEIKQWKNTSEELPIKNGVYKGKPNDLDRWWEVFYKDGTWVLYGNPEHEMKIEYWSEM